MQCSGVTAILIFRIIIHKSTFMTCLPARCISILRYQVKHLLFLLLSFSTVYCHATISCHHEVNISLNENCQFQLSPTHVLSHGNSTGPYTLMVTTPVGIMIPNNLLDGSHLDSRLTAKVTNAQGNSCWGFVQVEDKTSPVITCNDRMINCHETATVLPIATDACSSADVVLMSQSLDTLNCNNNFIHNIIQVFQAIDGSGNLSTCTQTVSVKRFDMSGIIWPRDTMIGCADFVLSGRSPNPIDYGVPVILGDSLLVISDLECNINVAHTDALQNAIGCPPKVLRTWTVSESHCDTVIQLSLVQTIEVLDFVPPSIICPADLTVQANGIACSANFALPLPTITDDCSGVQGLNLVYSNVALNNVTSSPTITISDDITVHYTASDRCGNVSVCSMDITVDGIQSPSISCPADVTVGCSNPSLGNLTSFGVATATDGCAALLPTENNPTLNLNSCNVGSILRNFSVSYLGSTYACQQRIVAQQDPAFIPSRVTCPTDTISVGTNVNVETLDTGMPFVDIAGINCANIAIEFAVTKIGNLACGEEFSKVWVITEQCSGVVSTCHQLIQTQEASSPSITCPSDLTIDCGNPLLDDINNFGTALGSDGCDVIDVVELPDGSALDDCGSGSVIRIFQLPAPLSGVFCVQTIDVLVEPAFEDSRVTCPEFLVNVAGGAVPDTVDTGFPTVDLTGIICSNIFIDFTVTEIGVFDCGVEYQKRWTIRDECTGVISFCDQIITAGDNPDPILVCSDFEIPLEECDADSVYIPLLPVEVSSCDLDFTVSNDSPFANDNNDANSGGTYPLGTTTVTVTLNDNGVLSSCSYTVTVFNPKAEIVSCKKIIESIQPASGGNPPMGLVDISQACATVSTICDPSMFLLSFDSNDMNAVSFFVDCDDAANPGGIVPGGYTVYLWNNGVVIDSCNNFVQALDGAGNCLTPVAGPIVGSVFTENNIMIPEVMVELQGYRGNGVLTDGSGHYAYEDILFNQEYNIIPSKIDDQLNGVSTMDLILLQRHILGLELLNSPYKIIAADMDRSDQVNVLDFMALRNLILGTVSDEYTENSWRMIDAAHEFIDPYDPFYSKLPESYFIDNLTDEMEVDFIGVKLGDLNSSTKVVDVNNGLIQRDRKEQHFSIAEKKYSTGQLVDVSIGVPEAPTIQGFQLTLEIDPALSRIISLESSLDGFDEDAYHINKETGKIHLSYISMDETGSFPSGQSIVLTIGILSSASTSDIIHLSESGLEAEVYIDSEAHPGSIEYLTTNGIDLLQNSPNPWSHTTEIKFYLSYAEDVILKVYNAEGKYMFQMKEEGRAGLNNIILSEDDFDHGGIYYYEISHGLNHKVQKMILAR